MDEQNEPVEHQPQKPVSKSQLVCGEIRALNEYHFIEVLEPIPVVVKVKND